MSVLHSVNLNCMKKKAVPFVQEECSAPVVNYSLKISAGLESKTKANVNIQCSKMSISQHF